MLLSSRYLLVMIESKYIVRSHQNKSSLEVYDYTDINDGATNKFMFYRVSAYEDVDNEILSMLEGLIRQKRKVSLKEIENMIKNPKKRYYRQHNSN